MDKMLMNPRTGSVDTEESWKYDAQLSHCCFDDADLIEVEMDINGEWVEVE